MTLDRNKSVPLAANHLHGADGPAQHSLHIPMALQCAHLIDEGWHPDVQGHILQQR